MKALTIGTFDVLHYGHVAFLAACRELAGDSGLTVGVNSDPFAASCKGKPPVMDGWERVHALRQLGYDVRVSDGPGRLLIEEITPALLIVGSDWAGRDYPAQIGVDQAWLDQRVISLAYVARTRGMPMSTSEIRRRILAADRG